VLRSLGISQAQRRAASLWCRCRSRARSGDRRRSGSRRSASKPGRRLGGTTPRRTSWGRRPPGALRSRRRPPRSSRRPNTWAP